MQNPRWRQRKAYFQSDSKKTKKRRPNVLLANKSNSKVGGHVSYSHPIAMLGLMHGLMLFVNM
jgi:hypothetical protein